MASVDRAGAPALRATRNAGMLSLNSEPASISGSQLIKHPSAFHVAYYCNGSYSATDRSRFCTARRPRCWRPFRSCRPVYRSRFFLNEARRCFAFSNAPPQLRHSDGGGAIEARYEADTSGVDNRESFEERRETPGIRPSLKSSQNSETFSVEKCMKTEVDPGKLVTSRNNNSVSQLFSLRFLQKGRLQMDA
jgi:hypothetical protein